MAGTKQAKWGVYGYCHFSEEKDENHAPSSEYPQMGPLY